MAKVNILALGGLDEKDRGLYILEIDSKIFILDSGVYEPLTDDFGIKYLVPNMNYLTQNRDKIKGVFLSSLNWNKIGSLPQVIEVKKDVAIYGSASTIKSLNVHFGDKANSWNTNVVKSGEKVNVAGFDVEPFSVASKIPGTLGYNFKTNDGNIVYMVDFIFDSMIETKTSTIESISKFSNENNLLLIADSSVSRDKDTLLTKSKITNLVKKQILKEKRIVVSLYDDEIFNVIELINVAREYKRKLLFKNENLLNLVKLLMETGDIEEFPVSLFKTSKDRENTDVIVVISSTKSKLYKDIEVMIEENNVEDFVFTDQDIFIAAAMPLVGNEHVFADVSNKISRIEPVFIKLSADEKKTFGTTEFDIRNVINFLKPNYFMPVGANFREQKAAKEIAISNGVNEKNVFVADNGEKYSIFDKQNQGMTQNGIECDSKVIEDSGEKSVNSTLIDERMSLGKDGIATISFFFNKEKKAIASDIDIQMKGVVISKGQEELMQNIKELILVKTDEVSETNESFIKMIPATKKLITRLFREAIKKTPTIEFNVIEI